MSDRGANDRFERRSGRPWIVDGGLATTLEARGFPLHPELWSAGVFLENPRAIQQVHEDFVAAGAEILITASYQMSFEGLARAGFSSARAAGALADTVAVARAAANRSPGRVLVAGSIGPYGAILADGSEYRGDYGLGERELVEFHRPRLEALCDAAPDLLAFETIPSLAEARALVRLLDDRRQLRAWCSFSCPDSRHISDGTRLADAAAELDRSEAILALGINCTAPGLVSDLMGEIRSASSKPIVIYPNSGEHWDASARCWTGDGASASFLDLARGWAAVGAWAIGGCCRIGPGTIRELAEALRSGS